MKSEYKIWLDKAEEDLLAVEILMAEDNFPAAIVCFHCQQAAEKFLKAFLVSRDIQFPKTHDLVLLLDQFVLPADSTFENIRENCLTLTDYAISSRYPDFLFLPSKVEAEEALSSCLNIRDLVQTLI